ncbi:unnamed protein product [Anisakis simplex]|uniref:triacylglycerol lipase n=1 Tax=Anisakis simplex TaxID=6269 RepID=A0A0M3JT12_ANISI|nr:unnamed protein product [Anisakis simplex]
MDLSKASLSFCGCGFLCIYHAGVCAALKEYAPQLLYNKIAGASAGSIVAAGLICNVCVSQAASAILKVVTQARSRALGALHPAFNLIEVVRTNLTAVLPENAHQLCTGRLQISLTRERDRKNVIISKFDSKQELIQAILCSCFIPYYCGRVPPIFRGEHYLDGGWSDNQPIIDENTITVSPFSGESDICPPDVDSASLFGFQFGGTSIRFTARNIYRLTVCLIPPSTEVCSRICRQGFEDTIRFLTRNGVVPCMRCLAVQSSFINLPDSKLSSVSRKSRSQLKVQRASDNSSQMIATTTGSDTTECKQCSKGISNGNDDNNNNQSDSLLSSSLFPQILQRAIEEASQSDNRLLAYLLSFRLLRWLKTTTEHVTLPFEFLFIICKNIAEWIAGLAEHDWIRERFQLIVDFVLKEIENQRTMYSARLTCQLAVTEMDVSSCKSVRPGRAENLVSDDKESKRRQGEESDSPDTNKSKNDTLNHVFEYARTHDAVLAYYYRDDDDQVKLCEIFDVRNPERRHRCHSHLEHDVPISNLTDNS